MRGLIATVAVVLVAVLAVAFVPADDAEADSVVSENSTWYCYGDHPTFVFPSYTESVDVTWEVTDSDDGTVIMPENQDESSIQVDLTGHDRITVTQHEGVNGGEPLSMTIHVIALHIPVDTVYTVTFHDGEYLRTYSIDRYTVVEQGQDHVIAPLLERDGYEFMGWFEKDAIEEYNLKQPVEGNVDLYAKWKYNGVSGGSASTEAVGTNTVLFNTSVGLYCEPDEPGSNSISFSVGVLGGYILEGAISVTTTGGNLMQIADGQYLLTGIDGNVVVTVSGNTVLEDYNTNPDPDDPNDPVDVRNNDYTMYAIILVIVAIICIALAVYIMRTRGSRV